MRTTVMQTPNFHLKLEHLHELTRIEPLFIDIFRNLLTVLFQHSIPQETVMITVESLDCETGMCTIFALVSDDHGHLGRREKYARCIFSQYRDSLNRVVVIDNVKRQSAYLSLDSRVQSEVFYELEAGITAHLIVNAEFSTAQVSDPAKKWFSQMIESLKRGNV